MEKIKTNKVSEIAFILLIFIVATVWIILDFKISPCELLFWSIQLPFIVVIAILYASLRKIYRLRSYSEEKKIDYYFKEKQERLAREMKEIDIKLEKLQKENS